MNHEELKAKYEALNSMDDAYALAKENGFEGTMEDFAALCTKAAEKVGGEQMSLDDMESVAGGFDLGETASDVIDWIKENPAETAAIVVGSAVAVAGIATAVSYGVYRYRSSAHNMANFNDQIGELTTKKITGGTVFNFSKQV